MALSIIFGAGVIISLIFTNILLAIFLFISGFFYVMFSHKIRTDFFFELTRKGLESNDTFYPMDGIKSFNVVDVEGDKDHLILQVGGIEQKLCIPVFDNQVEDIVSFLEKHKVEKNSELRFSMLDRIAKNI